MSATNGRSSRVNGTRVVSALPFVKQATEATEVARDLFILVGGVASQLLDVLEEMRAEDVRHHKALERHLGIEDGEAGELDDVDDLDAVMVRHG